MANARKARKEATRAKVLDAAGVCFRTIGYERSTIRDIANTAGVSTGSIFSNWPGKDALYRELFGHAPVSPELGAGLLNVLRRALASGESLYGVDVDMARGLVAQAEEA